MNKFWIALFATVPIMAIAFFLIGMSKGNGLWLPVNITSIGEEIDHLFWVILALTGVTFFGVEAVFIWFLIKYGGDKNPGKGIYSHGNPKLETIWTIIPAGILVFLALYQYDTWKDAKFKVNAPSQDQPVHARVTGGQFEWRLTYPGADGQLDTADDLEQVNVLHVVKNEPTRLQLRSRDVLHSFFIPAARLKQDLVPGMPNQQMWFTVIHTDDDPSQADVHEIACAELCGWGHYKMRGFLKVHETREQFEAWFQDALAKQNATTEDLGLPE
ncbi:MAG: cytochrome c oxidase subunit II [Planctomycetota bacterium]|nr:MAG: cytochrome c oxidase subunit II [Planctomycetota bacterium]